MANTMMDLDFTGVESFSLIPLGTHTVKVKDAEFKKAQTGSDQLEINFEAFDGATRKAWFSLVPQALWKVKQVLEALGVSCEGKIRLNTKTLVGKTCQITVETDVNDESRQIVTRVSKIPTAQEATVTAPPFIQPTPAPVEAAPMTPTPPSESVAAPAQPEPTAPQGNLPPWMQAAQNTANSAPQGNLPPWMRPKQ